MLVQFKHREYPSHCILLSPILETASRLFEGESSVPTNLGFHGNIKLNSVLTDFSDRLLVEQDPTVLAEVEEARRAYRAGEYQTLQNYIADRPEQAS